MNRHHALPCPRAFALAVATAVAVVAALAPPARGQADDDPLAKMLTDPDKIDRIRKENARPPLEFSRSQVMPNDVLPYIKANHWSMFALEMRANHDDYEGSLQSRPVLLADQPHEMIYRREARLVKGQRTRLTLPILLATIPKELPFQLIRPDAIREDEQWLASCRVIEPHQQMVVVLTRGANDGYLRWSSLRATLPTSARMDDPLELEKARYYRMVLPLDADKPLLSSHPLTWSPISHVIWDGLEPEKLNVAQQQAMVDWLHWGGQLIVVGGAGPSFAPLRDSFLSPFLPAEASGDNAVRSGEQLKPLSDAYPPPARAFDADEPIPANAAWDDAWSAMGRRYRPPEPIRATEKKPIFVAALRPRPGATVIPLGGPDDPPLGVEWRVGRGRVLMLAVSPTDPDLIAWPGFDTLIRRVVLRRPEERIADPLRYNQFPGGGYLAPRYHPLVGPDLTAVRYLSRDLGAPTRKAVDPDVGSISMPTGPTTRPTSNWQAQFQVEPAMEVPVCEWLDSAKLPSLARRKLEEASGIEVPSARFVLRVILAYILALVPLNWLLCRYVFGRREWAWVVAPALALGFAVVVERAAAYDVGYDSSCDEIDVLETHGDYPRGHLSRFASLYSTGRVRFSISYPGDSTALALPLATGRSLRGEEAAQSSFQALPTPEMAGFQVQPRSLALFRAEQMASLPGTVALSAPGEGPRTIANNSGLDLKEAWVVEVREPGRMHAAFIGEIAAGARVPLPKLEPADLQASEAVENLSPVPFATLLAASAVASRPEEVGELRLIAWSPKPLAGQAIDPPVDRHRGFALMVAHLAPAPLLDPASPRYNALARGTESPPQPPDPATMAPIPAKGTATSPYRMRGSGRRPANPAPTPALSPTPPPAEPAPEMPEP